MKNWRMKNWCLSPFIEAVERRDPFTGGHLWRMAAYADLLGRALGLSEGRLAGARQAACLHDLGKLGVPEALLAREGLLEDHEVPIVRRHPRLGWELLDDNPIDPEVRSAVLHHHERWDGGGYPGRLKREAIPELARLIGVCDAFDAMTSPRPYRQKPMSPARAIEELIKHSERQFDPLAVERLARLHREGALAVIVGRSEPAVRLGVCSDCGPIVPLRADQELGATVICPRCSRELAIASIQDERRELIATGRTLRELPP
jgi:HD-GYP domain-containing protein (c-di-GMP phosphodiesterase class II)